MSQDTSVVYQVLEAKIAERGIKKAVIARAAGITPKALANKMHGKTPFKWPEVQIIQERFFPDIDKDELFRATMADRQAPQPETQNEKR